jgi:peptide-methionine (S)-S-oxide reductase
METKLQTAIFGGGCFWCTEAIFKSLKGAISVMPGYSGGSKPNPTYEEVCGGATGHIEAVKIEFDPGLISFRDLLEVFFATHDPTTPNRQGNDVGEQYASVIFYGDENQKFEAEKFIRQLEEDYVFEKPIVTQIRPLAEFYEAEDYHRDYFKNNPAAAYCQIVINPKLEKFKKKFASLVE